MPIQFFGRLSLSWVMVVRRCNKNKNITKLLVAILMAIACSVSLGAQAGPASAIVEKAATKESAGSPLVREFETFSPGQIISLGKSGKLVIDYFATCARETITGGTVTIGEDGSTVTGGKIRRDYVACDNRPPLPGFSILDFRGIRRSPASGHVAITRTIYALCPVARLAGAHSVTIERLDQSETPQTVTVVLPRRNRDFYDFATGVCPFVAGGTYRLSFDNQSVEFSVDPAVRRRTGPLVGRLLLM